MKRRFKKIAYSGLTILTLAATTGCGNKKASAIAIIQGETSGKTGAGGLRVSARTQARHAQDLHEDITLAQATGKINSTPDPVYSSGNIAFGDTTCTQVADTYTCAFSNEYTFTCGADTYGLKNGSLTMNISLSDPYVFKFNYSIEAKGGDLGDDYQKLDCAIDLSKFLQSYMANPTAMQNLSMSDREDLVCENFSCTYGGESIDCDDFAEAQADVEQGTVCE